MEIKRTVLAVPGGGTELIYTTSEGAYLGRVRFEAFNPQGMELMAKDALDWLAEQKAEAERPQIALAVASGMRGN